MRLIKVLLLYSLPVVSAGLFIILWDDFINCGFRGNCADGSNLIILLIAALIILGVLFR